MRLCAVLPLLALAPVLNAAQPTAMSWSDLALSTRPDWTIRVVLPDGTAVEGKPARFEPDALLMRVVRTSNKSLHPEGEISIPRAQIKVVEIRKSRHKGRRIGALVPVAAGIGLGVALAASATSGNECTELGAIACSIAAGYGAGIGLGVAVVGGTAGYFIGRSSDRRFEPFTVTDGKWGSERETGLLLSDLNIVRIEIFRQCGRDSH